MEKALEDRPRRKEDHNDMWAAFGFNFERWVEHALMECYGFQRACPCCSSSPWLWLVDYRDSGGVRHSEQHQTSVRPRIAKPRCDTNPGDARSLLQLATLARLYGCV